MDTLKDCNTCESHVQGEFPPPMCQYCLNNKLTFWKPMSKSYDEAFRTEGSMLDRRGPQTIGDLIKPSAFNSQVAGDHYKSMKIQPIEFAVANKLDFFQLNIIKYITRKKGDRKQDLDKAKHYLEMYIEAVGNGF